LMVVATWRQTRGAHMWVESGRTETNALRVKEWRGRNYRPYNKEQRQGSDRGALVRRMEFISDPFNCPVSNTP
jgi:hypothetical protein